MKIGLLMTAAAIAFTAVPALACDRAQMREQFQAARAEAFQQADADGNGALSPEEFTAFHQIMQQNRAKAQFSYLDANGDGQVTEDELSAARPPHGPRP